MFYTGYWFESSLASAVAYILIALFTIVGNGVICVAYGKDPYGQLRRPHNFFLANLAFSDLLMGAFAETILASTHWVKGNNGDLYFAHYVFAILSGSSSLLNLTALSVIRYYAVKDPFTYQARITQSRVLLVIILIWLDSLHLALLPVFGWQSAAYQLYLYGVGFGIPCFVIFLAYFGFYRAIRQHTERVTQMEAVEQGGAADEKNIEVICRVKNVIAREKKVTKTIVLIMSVFIAFWLPFLVIDIIMVQCVACRASSRLHLARDITLSITYFSSGINPLLYTWRVRQFRLAVKKLMGLENVEVVLPCGSKRKGVASNSIKISQSR